MSSVCYKCPDRHSGCHSSCIRYIEEKKKQYEKNQMVFEMKKRENEYQSYIRSAVDRMRTRRGK